MTEIIAESPSISSPSLTERLAAMRAEMDKKWARVQDPVFTGGERATMKNWSLQKRLDTAIKNLSKRCGRLPKTRMTTAPQAPHRGVRARRSPASLRRATTDSGGSDDGGDPEPPRPSPLYSLPAYRGGAL